MPGLLLRLIGPWEWITISSIRTELKRRARPNTRAVAEIFSAGNFHLRRNQKSKFQILKFRMFRCHLSFQRWRRCPRSSSVSARFLTVPPKSHSSVARKGTSTSSKRDVDSNRQLYEGLLQKLKE